MMLIVVVNTPATVSERDRARTQTQLNIVLLNAWKCRTTRLSIGWFTADWVIGSRTNDVIQQLETRIVRI